MTATFRKWLFTKNVHISILKIFNFTLQVESLLGLQQNELKEIRVGRAEVTFKVPRNSREYNATDIVKMIGKKH